MSNKAVLAAGSALLVAGIGLLLSNHSNNNNPKDLEDIDDLEEYTQEDFITPEEVVKVFDQLFMEMQHVYQQLLQQLQAIQMQQAIPEKQIRGLVRQEMERNLLAKQQAVVEQFDIDYDCLEAATWEFLENEEEHAEVKKAVERFQKLWEAVTGESVTGWRPGKDGNSSALAAAEDLLPPERLIPVAEKYFGALTDSMRGSVETFQAQGKNLKDPSVQQELHLEFSKNVNDAGDAALEAEGVSSRQFEASIKAHASNPQVGQALAMLQMQQQRQLMAMGIA